MKLAQLIKATPANIVENAKKVRMLDAKITTGKTSGTKTLKCKVQRVANQLVHDKHICSIKGKAPGKLSEVDVLVSCDCGLFVFFGAEYALFKRGAAEIIHGNGEAPLDKNPKLKIFLCHHLIRCAKKIVSSKL